MAKYGKSHRKFRLCVSLFMSHLIGTFRPTGVNCHLVISSSYFAKYRILKKKNPISYAWHSVIIVHLYTSLLKTLERRHANMLPPNTHTQTSLQRTKIHATCMDITKYTFIRGTHNGRSIQNHTHTHTRSRIAPNMLIHVCLLIYTVHTYISLPMQYRITHNKT